mgnify:FL=1
MCARPPPPPCMSPLRTQHMANLKPQKWGAKMREQRPNKQGPRAATKTNVKCMHKSQHTSHMPLRILPPVQRPHHLLAAWQPRHKPKRAQQREIVMQHKCLCCQETWLGQARALHVMHHNQGFPELLQCQTATWLRVRQDSINLLL